MTNPTNKQPTHGILPIAGLQKLLAYFHDEPMPRKKSDQYVEILQGVQWFNEGAVEAQAKALQSAAAPGAPVGSVPTVVPPPSQDPPPAGESGTGDAAG